MQFLAEEHPMTFRSISRAMLLATCCLFIQPNCLGQSNYARLSGTIFDPQHRAIPGASIQLVSISTHAVRQVTSNEQGIYQITALLPEEYKLNVQASGFSASTQTVHLEVGQQTTCDVTLQLTSLTGTVKIQSETMSVLRTTDASVGEVVEQTSIRNLPLNGRMLIDLVLTVPGAHESHGAQAGDMSPLYWRPGQRSAVSIGGNRPNANYFLLDGATNTDPTFNTLNLSPSPDSVREFKVQTGSYSAEMGGAGGGQVNIVTRSGSNGYHGTVYEFLRNGAMDAHSFNQMGNNHLVQNNFGASFGGPIIRNRTFFFVNYEGFRHAMADTMVATVATPEEISGDFSMSGKTIYNPFSAHSNPNYDPTKPISPSNPQIIRDPFPGNVIPANAVNPSTGLPLINPAAQQLMMNYVPMPNAGMGMSIGAIGCGMTMMGSPTLVGAGTDCNNYLDVRNELHVTNQATVRIDQMFARGDSVTARYSLGAENGFMPSSGSSFVTQNLPGFGVSHDNFSQQGSITWTHIVNPRMVNAAAITISRLAMSRWDENSNQ